MSSWACSCTFVNKAENSKCEVCQQGQKLTNAPADVKAWTPNLPMVAVPAAIEAVLMQALAPTVLSYLYFDGITIYSTWGAFAAKLPNGSVVTWGSAGFGGDSSSVQAELKKGVDTIYSTSHAFAAKLLDASVVTWGYAGCGGDSSSVQAELKKGVDTICSNDKAFAAKLLDGSVVTWGDARYGGDSSSVQAELKKGVDTIYCTGCAFAAKLLDGSVVTWGASGDGGDSSSVQAELNYWKRPKRS